MLVKTATVSSMGSILEGTLIESVSCGNRFQFESSLAWIGEYGQRANEGGKVSRGKGRSGKVRQVCDRTVGARAESKGREKGKKYIIRLWVLNDIVIAGAPDKEDASNDECAIDLYC